MSIDRAAALRNAEKLLRQGQLDAAIAEYALIVEEHPRDWTTANTLGDAYVRAGQIDKAVEQYVRMADALTSDGFLPRAAALYKKTIKLKPGHEPSLWKAAEIAATQGTLADARAYLKTLEDNRKRAGDEAGAVRVRIRMGTLDPANYAARRAAASLRVELGEVTDAVRDLLKMADELAELTRLAEAIDVLGEASRLAPDDGDVRTRLFDVHVASTDLGRAREFASTPEQIRQLADAFEGAGRSAEAIDLRCEAGRLEPGDNPADRVALLALEMRSGRGDQAAAIALELLQQDPSLRDQILTRALDAAAEAPEAAFRSALLVADFYVVEGEWGVAADAMAAFAERAPVHLPARARLVEICVDGMLESRLPGALAQLTDAYLAAGLGEQAREAAEELVAREPWELANFDRFRQALVLLHEPDPDAVIVERLSGETPFLSTVLNPDEGLERRPGVKPIGPVGAEAADAPRVDAEGGDIDVDLEDVFVQFRGEASRKAMVATAEGEYQRALGLKVAGDLDGCVEALLVASRTPSLRFAAGSLLGRVYKERGQIAEALDWFERAAQAPAPTPEAYHEVLFELVEGLEARGEITRALAIGLELQAEAGSYRDVNARIDRLTKVQG